MNHQAHLPRRRYSNDQKLRIVEAALTGEQSKAAVVRAHDINANQLSRWIKEYHEGAAWRIQATKLLPVTVDASSRALIADVKRPCSITTEQCAVEVTLNTGHQLILNNPSGTLLASLLAALT